MNILFSISGLILSVVITTQIYASQLKSSDQISMINFTVGEVGVVDNIDQPMRIGFEYRMPSFSSWKIIPALGFARAENGASFFYADFRRDYWINSRWVLTPSYGLGSFQDSNEIELGNTLEFRAGVEIANRFYKHYRVGVALFHLSNGSLGDKNPGTEAIVFSLSIPLAS